MDIADKIVLITGANRGIGQAQVAEALRRGAPLAASSTGWRRAKRTFSLILRRSRSRKAGATGSPRSSNASSRLSGRSAQPEELDMTPNPNFTTAFVVTQSPGEVFRAINNPRGWWSEAIEGRTEKQGDEFTYHYKDMHRCRIRLVEVVPDYRVVWHVLDNHFSFTTDETEWKDTRIVFEVSSRDGETELRFTHQGLSPAYECFDVCSNAWGSYINGSLKSLITTGKGRPNSQEES